MLIEINMAILLFLIYLLFINQRKSLLRELKRELNPASENASIAGVSGLMLH